MALSSLTGPRLAVVVAHADDETLGAAGTLHKVVKQGVNVRLVVVADGESSRFETEGEDVKHAIRAREDACRAALASLGIEDIRFLRQRDNKLDALALVDLVRLIQHQLVDFQPTSVLTHFANDLNQDHRRVYEAVSVIARPEPSNSINALMSLYVASASDWYPGTKPFEPNLFVDISREISIKVEALKAYEIEMRPFPHARSIESIEASHKYWGSKVGLQACEPFVIWRHIS